MLLWSKGKLITPKFSMLPLLMWNTDSRLESVRSYEILCEA